MYALINTLPSKPQRTQVALAGPRPHRLWEAAPRSNPITLAERRVR